MQSHTDSDDFQASAALIRSSFKRLFETLLEQTADRIYIKDTQGRFIFASDALARTHGLKHRSEIAGMTDFDFFDHQTAQSFHDEEQEILRSNKPVVNHIVEETWRNGHTTWASESKVPLRLESGVAIGILGISRDVTEEHLNKEKLRAANATMLADYASAEEVQQVMIPGRIPEVAGVQLAYIWKPMVAVGGDIINFPRNPDDALLFFVGDVCGHGVQAAFYTVLLKYITAQAGLGYDGSPQQLLDTVNQQISAHLRNGFITGLAGHFGAVQPDGSRQLYVSHCGHPHLLILRAKAGQAEVIKLPNAMVMGLPGGSAAETVQVPLQPGDRVYTFTDGIIEASDASGAEFGLDRIARSVEASAPQALDKSLDLIYEQVAQFTGSSEQQDDITLLAFEVEPTR
jgi:PAS domain S-box-containing protein